LSYENTNESMLDMFVFETSQLIEQLEESILSNEEESYYSEDSINEIFRIMHTIKGSSAMMAFDNISSLAHTMEDLFYYLRDEKPKNVNYPVLTELILECIDYIKVEIQKIKNEDAADGDYAELIERIKSFLIELKSECSIDALPKVKENSSCTSQYYMSDNQNDDANSIHIYKAIVFFEEGCEMENVRAFGIVHHIKELTNEVYYLPNNIIDSDESIEVIRKEGFKVYIKTVLSFEVVNEIFISTAYIQNLTLTQLDNDDELKSLFGDPNQSISEKAKEEKVNKKKDEQTISTQQRLVLVILNFVLP
jgi:two-component system chemotaxis sensor kinase CheA